jgi:hypothetical protein
VHDLRIDGAADVLDRDVIEDLDAPGARVDREVAGMGAVAVGAQRGGEAPFRPDVGELRQARACSLPAPPLSTNGTAASP